MDEARRPRRGRSRLGRAWHDARGGPHPARRGAGGAFLPPGNRRLPRGHRRMPGCGGQAGERGHGRHRRAQGPRRRRRVPGKPRVRAAWPCLAGRRGRGRRVRGLPRRPPGRRPRAQAAAAAACLHGLASENGPMRASDIVRNAPAAVRAALAGDGVSEEGPGFRMPDASVRAFGASDASASAFRMRKARTRGRRRLVQKTDECAHAAREES